MMKYEVTHRLGAYVPGLGTRPLGGVFEVSLERAERLHLDSNPSLRRVEPVKRVKADPKPKEEPQATPPAEQTEV